MVVIFCRRSRWRNSFRPFGSPHSLIRQPEKQPSSSFEKRGEDPRRPLRAPLRILNCLDKRLPFCSQEQPRRRYRPSATAHLPSRMNRRTRPSRRCQRFKSEKRALKCFAAIRSRRHFAARAARGDFVSSFSSPWPRQTSERDGTLVW